MKSAGVPLPAPRPINARRMQIADAQGAIVPALKLLFSTQPGKSSMGANPQGGFFVIKVTKVTPGNALLSPGIIGQVEGELSQAAAQDYAQQFLADLKRTLKAKRNESAIEAYRARLLTQGG